MTPKEELEHWKRVAAWLASCHAATLEGMPQSTAKSERRRQTTICTKAARMLQQQEEPRRFGNDTINERIKHEITRCQNAVKEHGLEERLTK